MESLITEFPHDDVPAWLEEMADEFTEDPFCHSVMVGADEESVMMITMWDSAVVQEVEESLRSMVLASGSVRRLYLSVPQAQPPIEP